MNNKNYLRNLFLKAIISLVLAGSLLGMVHAQESNETSQEYRDAAIAAIDATSATQRLDRILLELAEFTKAGLIANRPDIEIEISNIVDDVAIGLAARRGALESEVIALYMQKFSLEELNQITEFFNSDIGQKFLSSTPGIVRDIDAASRVWREGISRDMNAQVVEKLKEADLF